MDLLEIFRRFRTDESGAVTVDWVVLTAAIVGLGLVVVTTVGDAISSNSNSVGSMIGSRSMADSIYTGNSAGN